MKAFLLAMALTWAAWFAAVPAFAQTTPTVGGYVEQLTGNTKNGVGVTLLGTSGGGGATVTTVITRPADTNAYAANDAFANSTSAPNTGGFALAGAAFANGGSGIITDMEITSSNDPATPLQGEIWVFDSPVTAVNDNAPFALSFTDTAKLIGVVPFTMATTTAGSGTSSYAQALNLAMGFTVVGSSTNLRFLVKVKNAYTPASGETITVRAKIIQEN